MRLATRKLLDKSFSGLGIVSIFIMGAALLMLITPIFIKGTGAFIFKSTVEHRLMMLEKFSRGNTYTIMREVEQAKRFVAELTQGVADEQVRWSADHRGQATEQ